MALGRATKNGLVVENLRLVEIKAVHLLLKRSETKTLSLSTCRQTKMIVECLNQGQLAGISSHHRDCNRELI